MFGLFLLFALPVLAETTRPDAAVQALIAQGVASPGKVWVFTVKQVTITTPQSRVMTEASAASLNRQPYTVADALKSMQADPSLVLQVLPEGADVTGVTLRSLGGDVVKPESIDTFWSGKHQGVNARFAVAALDALRGPGRSEFFIDVVDAKSKTTAIRVERRHLP